MRDSLLTMSNRIYVLNLGVESERERETEGEGERKRKLESEKKVGERGQERERRLEVISKKKN